MDFSKAAKRFRYFESCEFGKRESAVPSGYAHFVTIKSLASHMAIVFLIISALFLSGGVQEVFAEKTVSKMGSGC
jgi:uncharacterized membrane protein